MLYTFHTDDFTKRQFRTNQFFVTFCCKFGHIFPPCAQLPNSEISDLIYAVTLTRNKVHRESL